jgi:hypothetical protein
MQIHQSGFDYPHNAGLHLPRFDTLDAFRVSLHTREQFREALDALDPFTGEYATPVWEMSEAPQELDSAA